MARLGALIKLLMYGIYFNLKLDFAGFIFEDMVSLIRKKVATQNAAKNPTKKSKKDDGHPPNLILQRFFGLVFHDELMEKLPWNTSEKITMAKVFLMSSFNRGLCLVQ